MFGTDFSVATGRRLSGLENLAEALLWRLQTPTGGLFYDSEYGVDLREFVQGDWGRDMQYEIETLAKAQCELDPRVLEASVTAEQPELQRVRITLDIQTAEGPFALVLDVSSLEVSLLYAPTI
jgi:phage baseplate assembly protein W